MYDNVHFSNTSGCSRHGQAGERSDRDSRGIGYGVVTSIEDAQAAACSQLGRQGRKQVVAQAQLVKLPAGVQGRAEAGECVVAQ